MAGQIKDVGTLALKPVNLWTEEARREARRDQRETEERQRKASESTRRTTVRGKLAASSRQPPVCH